MPAVVSVDRRPITCTIARFLNEDNSVPRPPSPAWCLVVDGVMKTTFTLGQERNLLEAFFREGAGKGA